MKQRAVLAHTMKARHTPKRSRRTDVDLSGELCASMALFWEQSSPQSEFDGVAAPWPRGRLHSSPQTKQAIQP